MKMLYIAIISLSSIVTAASWVMVSWRATTTTQQITRQALRGCPPKLRADVLRASADLAKQLRADRWRIIAALLPGRRHDK